jgi:enoyl-CoA hydratase
VAQKSRVARVSEEILVRIDGSTAVLTLNRPEQRNALTPAMLIGLRKSILELETNSSVRVLVITGAGDQVFCSGADLKAAQAAKAAGDTSGRGAYRELLLTIVNCSKPTVALARGHVLAGGLGLFLACDLALATDDAEFSTPEINVGMFPMMVLALLERAAGRRAALEMAFLGDRKNAAEAVRIGILNRAFKRSEFEQKSNEFISRIANQSGAILRIGKEALKDVQGRPLPEQLETLEKALEKVMSSEDSREGIRAFAEKRKPQWKDA